MNKVESLSNILNAIDKKFSTVEFYTETEFISIDLIITANFRDSEENFLMELDFVLSINSTIDHPLYKDLKHFEDLYASDQEVITSVLMGESSDIYIRAVFDEEMRIYKTGKMIKNIMRIMKLYPTLFNYKEILSELLSVYNINEEK